MPSDNEKERTRVSSMGLRPSIAESVRDQDGNLDVNKAVNNLSDSRTENKLLSSLVKGLAIGCTVLIIANTCTSVAIAYLTRQFEVDPMTGLTTVSSTGDIMKTSEAIFDYVANIHNMTGSELSQLISIDFDNEIFFHVMGYSIKSNETVVLVAGGSLSFGPEGLHDVKGDVIIDMMQDKFVVDSITRRLPESPIPFHDIPENAFTSSEGVADIAPPNEVHVFSRRMDQNINPNTITQIEKTEK